jgi:hypothetical protein
MTVRRTVVVLTASLALLAACGDPNYAEDLKPPPTSGPTEGPGSGEALAALLFYRHQQNNPTVHMKGASCADIPVGAKAGTEVPCTIKYADSDDPDHEVMLTLDANDEWQMRDR